MPSAILQFVNACSSYISDAQVSITPVQYPVVTGSSLAIGSTLYGNTDFSGSVVFNNIVLPNYYEVKFKRTRDVTSFFVNLPTSSVDLSASKYTVSCSINNGDPTSVYMNLMDMTGHSWAVQKVTLTPLYHPNINDNLVGVADEITLTTDFTGSVTFPTVIPGAYMVSTHAGRKNTIFFISVPPYSSSVNAVDILTLPTVQSITTLGLPTLASAVGLTRTEADSLYQPIITTGSFFPIMVSSSLWANEAYHSLLSDTASIAISASFLIGSSGNSESSSWASQSLSASHADFANTASVFLTVGTLTSASYASSSTSASFAEDARYVFVSSGSGTDPRPLVFAPFDDGGVYPSFVDLNVGTARYIPSTNTIRADLQGTASIATTASQAGTATVANNVAVSNVSDNNPYNVVFVTGSSGYSSADVDANTFYYNPSTNILVVPFISSSFRGTASYASNAGTASYLSGTGSITHAQFADVATYAILTAFCLSASMLTFADGPYPRIVPDAVVGGYRILDGAGNTALVQSDNVIYIPDGLYLSYVGANHPLVVGNIGYITCSIISNTELEKLAGVSASVQVQLDTIASGSGVLSASLAQRAINADTGSSIPIILPTTTVPMQLVSHVNGNGTIFTVPGITLSSGAITASQFIGSASYAVSTSFAANAVNTPSASWASSSISASYADTASWTPATLSSSHAIIADTAGTADFSLLSGVALSASIADTASVMTILDPVYNTLWTFDGEAFRNLSSYSLPIFALYGGPNPSAQMNGELLLEPLTNTNVPLLKLTDSPTNPFTYNILEVWTGSALRAWMDRQAVFHVTASEARYASIANTAFTATSSTTATSAAFANVANTSLTSTSSTTATSAAFANVANTSLTSTSSTNATNATNINVGVTSGGQYFIVGSPALNSTTNLWGNAAVTFIPASGSISATSVTASLKGTASLATNAVTAAFSNIANTATTATSSTTAIWSGWSSGSNAASQSVFATQSIVATSSLYASSSTNATNASNVGINTTSTNLNYNIVFVSGSAGNGPIQVDSSGFTYNPNINVLNLNGTITASTVQANLYGTASIATTGLTASSLPVFLPSTTANMSLVTHINGDGTIYSPTGIIINNGAITASWMVGTSSLAVLATNADKIAVHDGNKNVNYPVTFVSESSGYQPLDIASSSAFVYNPQQHLLFVSGNMSASNFLGTASYALWSLTSSFALNGGGGTVDVSTYLSASEFRNWTGSNLSLFSGTASYAKTASVALNAGTQDLTAYLSSSWTGSQFSLFSGTSSFAKTASIALNVVPIDLTAYLSSSWTGSNLSVFSGTSSYAVQALSASLTTLALTASYAGFNFFNSSSINAATTTTVLETATSSYGAVFYDYYVVSSSNKRAGTVIGTWINNLVEFTEYSTVDIGNTQDITMSMDLNGGNTRLLSTATTYTWTIKAVARYL